jgi:hypothetical protein
MWRATPKHFPKSGEWSALAHTDGHPDSGAHHVRGGGGGGRAQKRGCGPPQPPTPTKASRRPRREPRCSMTAMRPPCSGSRWPSRAGPRALPARSVSLPKGRYGQMGGPGSAFPRARKAVGAARQSTCRDYQAQSTGEKARSKQRPPDGFRRNPMRHVPRPARDRAGRRAVCERVQGIESDRDISVVRTYTEAIS